MVDGAFTLRVHMHRSRGYVGLRVELAGFGIDLEKGPGELEAACRAAEENAAIFHPRDHGADVRDLKLFRIEP
jgi:hypothetical protein